MPMPPSSCSRSWWPATLFVAWRAPAATGAVAAAAAFVFIVFAEWAVRGNPDMLVLPGGPLPGIGPARHRRLRSRCI